MPQRSILLRLNQPYHSIKSFDELLIPPLTVIFGENGAGKTHLLQSIYEGTAYIGDTQREGDEERRRLNSTYVANFSEYNPFNMNVTTSQEGAEVVRLVKDHLEGSKAVDRLLARVFNTDETQFLARTVGGRGDLVNVALARGVSRENLSQFHDDLLDEIRVKNHSLADTLENVLDQTDLDVFSLGESDFILAPLAKLYGHIPVPNLGALFHRYAMLWRIYERQKRVCEIKGIKGPELSRFIQKNGSPPWEFYNKHLQRLGLHIEIVSPLAEGNHFGHIYLAKDGERIPFDNISSGEKVMLNMALSTVRVEARGYSVSRPDVILLDEPDAHLYPKLVRDMFEQVIAPLVSLGTNVIMTTHSPTSIAQVPEECIFQKHPGAGIKKVSRQLAIDHLLVGVPHVALDPSGRRQVFVESVHDEASLSRTYDLLRGHLPSERSLSFIAAGADKDGGKDRVKQYVKALRLNGNRAVLGIVDWDGKEVEKDGILVLGDGAFYTFENILLNPLLIGALLLKTDRSYLGLDSRFSDLSNFSDVDLQAIVDLIEGRLNTVTTEQRSVVELVGGQKVHVRTSLLRMNGHLFEDLLFSNLPILKGFAKRFKPKLMHTVIDQVITEHPGLCPIIVLNTLKSALYL